MKPAQESPFKYLKDSMYLEYVVSIVGLVTRYIFSTFESAFLSDTLFSADPDLGQELFLRMEKKWQTLKLIV